MTRRYIKANCRYQSIETTCIVSHSTVCQKNETLTILNILYSCKSAARNLACDILITLAINHIHNLPPHLSYISTRIFVPDIAQKLKCDIDKLKH